MFPSICQMKSGQQISSFGASNGHGGRAAKTKGFPWKGDDKLMLVDSSNNNNNNLCIQQVCMADMRTYQAQSMGCVSKRRAMNQPDICKQVAMCARNGGQRFLMNREEQRQFEALDESLLMNSVCLLKFSISINSIQSQKVQPVVQVGIRLGM